MAVDVWLPDIRLLSQYQRVSAAALKKTPKFPIIRVHWCSFVVFPLQLFGQFSGE